VNFDGKKTVAGVYIPLRLSGNNVFETVSTVQKGSKFKMEIRNTTECYIYVFGKETDGTSYTLFPYPTPDNPAKTKYSPFCGIAGYRLFPKNKSMSPDSIGTKDFIAVLVSKDTLNWYDINRQISQNPNQDYAARFNNVLGSKMIRNVRFQTSSKGNMQFKTEEDNNSIVACIVEIDK